MGFPLLENRSLNFAPLPHFIYAVGDGRSPYSSACHRSISNIRLIFDRLHSITRSRYETLPKRQFSNVFLFQIAHLNEQINGLDYGVGFQELPHRGNYLTVVFVLLLKSDRFTIIRLFPKSRLWNALRSPSSSNAGS